MGLGVSRPTTGRATASVAPSVTPASACSTVTTLSIVDFSCENSGPRPRFLIRPEQAQLHRQQAVLADQRRDLEHAVLAVVAVQRGEAVVIAVASG
jgi:hypothetical protein